MCWYVRMYACSITFGFAVLLYQHTNGNIGIHCACACVRVFMAKNDVHLLPSCKHFRSRPNQMLLNTCTTGIIMNCLSVCVCVCEWVVFFRVLFSLLLMYAYVYEWQNKKEIWCHIIGVYMLLYHTPSSSSSQSSWLVSTKAISFQSINEIRLMTWLNRSAGKLRYALGEHTKRKTHTRTYVQTLSRRNKQSIKQASEQTNKQ